MLRIRIISPGKLGHVYAVPGGFQMYFRGAPEFEEPTTSQGWTWCKKAVEGFAAVTQDGDGEGMLFLRADHVLSPDEAAIIRDKFGIPKKPEISEETRERLKAMAFRAAEERSPQKPASEGEAATPMPETAGGLSLSLAPPVSRGSLQIRQFRQFPALATSAKLHELHAALR